MLMYWLAISWLPQLLSSLNSGTVNRVNNAGSSRTARLVTRIGSVPVVEFDEGFHGPAELGDPRGSSQWRRQVAGLVIADDRGECGVPDVEVRVMNDVDETDLRSGLRGRPASGE